MLGAMSRSEVEAQYTRGDVLSGILAALAAAGKDPEHIGPDDLVMVEEFHTLGPAATAALAEAAGLGAGDHVLDAGCGIGGPARHIARSHGCRVTGVDFTAKYCEAAVALTRRSGLAGQVSIVCGDATALPFPARAFDVAWTQHASMNIADKAGLYGELRRVVRPGGRLAFFDVVAGPNQPIPFPIMWADDPAWSFLEPAARTREFVEAAGFSIATWEDMSEQSQAFFAMAVAAAAAGPPGPLGIHLILSNPRPKFGNFLQSLEEDRVRVIRCVAVAGAD